LSETTPRSISDAILALQPGHRRAAMAPVPVIVAAAVPPEVPRKKPRSVLDAVLAMQPVPVEVKPTGPRWGRRGPQQRAATERALERQAAARRKVRQRAPVINRLVCCMEPGKWYARADVVRAIGGGRGDRCRFEDTLRKRGLVKRALNTTWAIARKCGEYPKWLPQPKWFYQLTDLGVEFRKFCLLST
jgi:type IV secretory pathway VirB10-like protein